MKRFILQFFVGCIVILSILFANITKGQTLPSEFQKTTKFKYVLNEDFSPVNLLAQVNEVKVIKVPDDYPTIAEGINAAESGDTVVVDKGTYHENDIHLKAGVFVRGAGIDSSVVNGDGLTVFIGADNAVLEGFTITNASGITERGVFCWSSAPIIQNNKISNCYNGISVADNAIIRNNFILNNQRNGIFCGSSNPDNNPQINRNLIIFNYTGLASVSSDFIAINNTFDLNSDAVWIQSSSNDITPVAIVATNNIITRSNGNGIYMSSSEDYGVDPQNMTITYNDIWNNSPNFNNNWNADSTNIEEDPLYAQVLIIAGILKSASAKNEEAHMALNNELNTYYTNIDRQLNDHNKSTIKNIANAEGYLILRDFKNSLYCLNSNSPCIDAGDPNGPMDPDETRADIGARYFDKSINTPVQEFEISDNFILFQNYPNPFNSFTTIRFSIPETSHVKLKIYDITGREVRTLAERKYIAGIYEINWDGTDKNGFSEKNGIYFVELKTGNIRIVKKMMLQPE